MRFIRRVPKLDNFAYKIVRDFIEGAIYRDSGIIFNPSFYTDVKGKVKFMGTDPLYRCIFQILHPFIHGPCIDPMVEPFLILFVKPSGKDGIKFLKRFYLRDLNKGEELLPNRPVPPFNFASTRTVVRLAVNQTYAKTGTGKLQVRACKN